MAVERQDENKRSNGIEHGGWRSNLKDGFPFLAQQDVRIENRWVEPRRPLQLKVGARLLSLLPASKRIFSIDAGEPHHRHLCSLKLKCFGEPAWLVLPHHFLLGMIEGIDAELAPLLAPEHDLYPIVLEAMLAPIIELLESNLQTPIELMGQEPVPGGEAAPPVTLNLQFRLDQQAPVVSSLCVTQAQTDALLNALKRWPRHERDLNRLAFEMSVRLGSVRLTAGELKNLSTGDVVLLDQAAISHIGIVIADYWAFPSRSAKGQLVVTAPGRQLSDKDQEIWSMSNNKPAGPDSQSDPIDVDKVPVKLVFELDRRELELGELRRIAPGHTFTIERPADGIVQIYSGQRRIGAGEIVRIEGQIGVRLTQLFIDA